MSNGRLNAWKVEEEEGEEVPLVLRVKASPVVHARRRRLDHLALALRTPFYLVLFLPLKEGSWRRQPASSFNHRIRFSGGRK